MALTITSVPEKISRADYLRLVESVGIRLDECVELRFGPSAIYATVLARDADGKAVGDIHGAALTHDICIRVEDED